MADTKKTGKGATVVGKLGDLTPNDLRLVAIAWNCLTDPKIDMDKFTTAAGYTSAQSARVCWNTVRRKLEGYFASLSNGQSGTPTAAPKARGGVKRKKAAVDESDNSTPPPKKRKTPAKATAVIKTKVDEHHDVAEEEGTDEQSLKGTASKGVRANEDHIDEDKIIVKDEATSDTKFAVAAPKMAADDEPTAEQRILEDDNAAGKNDETAQVVAPSAELSSLAVDEA
ncbi:hypothetical protein SUNI508_04207 [Seiridium unicorne]|uniref:Uncharacterized protein n=1 Tax=Seiridium unicorne TaxID=138068 RepID=A0ABR2V9N3_9PEZI